MSLALLLLSLGVTAVIVTAWYRYLRPRPAEQRSYHFRCRHCGQKLRYEAGSCGQKVLCPQCLRSFTLPQNEAEASPDARPRVPYRVRRI
jgi:hypothetical protein